jgi:two-component system response regulator YesN
VLEWLLESLFFEDIVKDVQTEIENYFSSQNTPDPMKEIVNLIHEEYTSKRLTLMDVSRRFYLSSAYICVLFKEFTGKTFVKYLTEYRIKKAIDLMRDRRMKINEIAELTGFDSGDYFSKILRKEKGISPVEYRKQHFDD